MIKIKIYFVLCFFVALGSSVFAQTYKLENIGAFEEANIKPIRNENGIIGYVLFYKTGQADYKNDNYIFELLDEKLNKVNRLKMLLPAYSNLVQSAHNGTTLGMMFYNVGQRKCTFQAYDNNLKLVGSAEKENMNKDERRTIYLPNKRYVAAAHGILPIPNKGFVHAGCAEDEDKFLLTVYDVNFKEKWHYQTPKSAKGVERFLMSDINDKYVSGLIMRYRGLKSTKFEYFLAVFDLETGKKLLDVSVENGKENLSISATNLLDNDLVLVQGEHYEERAKAGVKASNGIYLKKFDIKTGKEITEKKLMWKDDIEKMFDEKGAERIKDKYSSYLMSLFVAANGHTYMVYEQYKRGWGGITVQAGDLWMLELDENHQPTEMRYYAKKNHNVSIPSVSPMYGVGRLGILAQKHGAFGHQFTQQSADLRTFNVVYVAHGIEESEKNQHIIANIFMTDDGSINYDKVNTTAPKEISQYVYPALGNSLMLAQYNSIEGALFLELIKMNY